MTTTEPCKKRIGKPVDAAKHAEDSRPATTECGPESTQHATATRTERLRVGQLHANDWNPNRMDNEEFDELVAEVRHLGRLPKPIVVRKLGNNYEIVDGEHGWRAAKKVGLDAVTCEVIAANDFEAMRQTHKRNQHGTHSPVREGQMFQRMLQEAGLSQRKLASRIGISEGTIRNALFYAAAAKLRNDYALTSGCADRAQVRNGYAPGVAERMDRLTVAQARYYAGLPGGLRDLWLDAGASLKHFSRVGFDPQKEKVWLAEVEKSGLLAKICRQGKPNQALAELYQSYRSWGQHGRELFDRRGGFYPFLEPLLEHGLPLSCLDTIPIVEIDGEWAIPFGPDQWSDMVRNVVEKIDDESDCPEWLKDAATAYCRQQGIATGDIEHPAYLMRKADLEGAPAYIRDSSLGQYDKWWLHMLPDMDREELDKRADADQLEKIIRETIGVLETRDAWLTGKHELADEVRQSGMLDQVKARWVEKDVKSVFLDKLQSFIHDQDRAERDALFKDRQRVEELVIEELRHYAALRKGTVDGRPAIEVLDERIRAMEWPELCLLTAYMLNKKYDAASAAPALWLAALESAKP